MSNVIEFVPSVAALKGFVLQGTCVNYGTKDRAAAARKAWITIRKNRKAAARKSAQRSAHRKNVSPKAAA